MTEIIQYFVTLPLWEWLAVITALLYVYFAAKENILCWPMALISTTIYTIIFYDVYLWMDSVLQIYYFVMGVYGWACWYKTRTPKHHTYSVDQTVSKTLNISSWSYATNFIAVTCLSVVSLIVGYFMSNYTNASFPYLDAATTVFAVFATYLVTQKVIENWWYWIVIDLVSIYIYIEKSLTPTAFLFAIYVVFAVYGYLSWKKRMFVQMPIIAAHETSH